MLRFIITPAMRWDYAFETTKVEWKKEVAVAFIAALACYLVRQIRGSPEGFMDDLIAIGIAVFASCVVYPLVEFSINFIRAARHLQDIRIGELTSQIGEYIHALNLVGAPSLDMTYNPSTKNIYLLNRGNANVLICGTKLSDGPLSENAPRVITPQGDYHIEAHDLESIWATALQGKDDLRHEFKLHLQMPNQQRYVNVYHFWVRAVQGSLKISTQNLGATPVDDFPKQ